MIKSFFDIDEEMLQNLKSEEALKEEHKHINALLQQNDMVAHKWLSLFVLLTITGISTAIWHFFQSPDQEDIYSKIEFFLTNAIGLYGVFYIIFLVILIITSIYGFGLKKRKKIIINLLNEIYIKAQDTMEKIK